MQAVADMMQVEVETCSSPHATPLGAVELARKAIEPGRALADCIPAWSPAERFVPNWSSDQASNFLGEWRDVVDRIVPK